MAFPDNTTLIDDFNRASLGANWTAFFGSGIRIPSVVEIVTGQGASDSSDASYYNAATYGPSAQFYAPSRVGVAGTWQAIHFVTTPGSGTTDGYAIYVSYDGTNRARGYRLDNDVLTQVGSQVSYTPADADLFGLDRGAGTGHLKAWVNTGSSWTDLGGSWSDSTYTTGTSWRVGLECSFDYDNNGNAWGELRGGTVSGGSTTPISVSDSASLSESFLKRVDKLLADAVSLVEARLLTVGKRVSDSVSLTENLAAVKVAVKAVSDTVALTESLALQVEKRFAETVSLTEARVLSVGKALSDSVGLTEGFAALRVAVVPLAEGVALTEARLLSIGKVLAEAVGLSESLGIQTTGAVVGWDAYLFWRRRTQMRRAYILRYRTRCGLRV